MGIQVSQAKLARSAFSAMLRANREAQQAIQKEIKGVESKIAALAQEYYSWPGARTKLAWRTSKRWAVRVEASNSESANTSALGIARVCSDCGFRVVCGTLWEGEPGEGVHIQSGLESAQLALLLQGAFQIANIQATLVIHEFGAPESLAIRVRANGI